jgi:hypothetical protein
MKYYSAIPGNLPELDRVDYQGYGYDEVIDPHKVRTFKEAKQQHRLHIKELIKQCQDELSELDKLKPEDCYQTMVH